MPNTFPKGYRLLTQNEYSVVLRKNTIRIPEGSFLVLCHANSHNHSRLGLAIAKKLLKKASDRNRIKRLVRESYRKKKDELGAVDIVILGRHDIALKDNQQIIMSLGKIWKRLQGKF